MIGALYAVERTITEQNLQGDQKRALSQSEAKSIAEQLVDVVQHISEHPYSSKEDLNLRRWKPLFANTPMLSALHQTVAKGNIAA